MKRTLFFWIDKLQIRRVERITLSVLMCISILLSTALLLIDFSPSPTDYNYEELERVFHQRSEIQQAEHDAIMARYTPRETTPPVTITEPEDLEPIVKTYESAEPEQQITDTTRININKADAEQLQQLPGIGPAYADRIVEWRRENGKFQSVEQLLEIRGIGPARLKNIRDLVVL